MRETAQTLTLREVRGYSEEFFLCVFVYVIVKGNNSAHFHLYFYYRTQGETEEVEFTLSVSHQKYAKVDKVKM